MKFFAIVAALGFTATVAANCEENTTNFFCPNGWQGCNLEGNCPPPSKREIGPGGGFIGAVKHADINANSGLVASAKHFIDLMLLAQGDNKEASEVKHALDLMLLDQGDKKEESQANA